MVGRLPAVLGSAAARRLPTCSARCVPRHQGGAWLCVMRGAPGPTALSENTAPLRTACPAQLGPARHCALQREDEAKPILLPSIFHTASFFSPPSWSAATHRPAPILQSRSFSVCSAGRIISLSLARLTIVCDRVIWHERGRCLALPGRGGAGISATRCRQGLKPPPSDDLVIATAFRKFRRNMPWRHIR